MIRKTAITISLLVVIGGLTLYFYALSGGTGELFQGNYLLVDYENLSHDITDDAYLICDGLTCPLSIVDEEPRYINSDLQLVRSALFAFIDQSPAHKMLELDIAKNQFDIGETVPGEPYYGIVSIRLAAERGQTKLVAYAYQPIGSANKSEHARRLGGVIDSLNEQLAKPF